MGRLTTVIFVICLFQANLSEAGCKESSQPSLESTRRDCRRPESIDTEERDRILRECLLARPVAKFEIEQARSSISDSNCFLMAVLRPEVTEAIKRGAIDYLAMPQSRRTSEGVETLRHALDKALNAARPENSDESEDVFILLRGFIEGRYDFYGLVSGPVSRLEEEGRRQGIYHRRYSLLDWIVFEYASYLTGSHTLRDEARKLLKQLDISAAPPKSYSAKGCKKKILYRWPQVGIPIDSYGGTPGWPETYEIGEDAVHWGVCPDDHSLWVYHYRSGWKKASVKEASRSCEDDGRSRPAGLVCKASGQR